MAGTINIYITVGSPSSVTDTTGHVYFTEADNTTDTHVTSPIGKPSGATNTAYGYEKWLKFYCAVAPDNQFTNFKIWAGSLSSPVTGVEFRVGTSASYSGSVITKSAVATSYVHSVYPSYDDALSVSGTLTAAGHSSGYFVIQPHVTSAAPNGTVDSTETIFHLAWDES